MKYEINNKTVLVTGGTGFVGSHVVEHLLKSGAHVLTTSQSETPQSFFYSQKMDKNTTILPVNINDFEKVFAAVTKHEVDFIFHLAAQPLVETAFYNPAETLNSNIIGTVNVLECVRRYPRVKGVIVASSDKAYGKTLKKTKYVETDRLSGDHPYEVSKSAADLICTSYVKTYKLPVITTRFGNIYGEGDLNYSRIIPGVLQAAITKKNLEIRSDGTYVRDYIYVKDVAAGYVKLAEQIESLAGEAFNFGSDDTLSVLDLLQIVQKTLKIQVKYTIMNNAKNEIPYQSLDYTKIQESINWKPHTKMSKILPSLYKWYKKEINRR